MKLRDQKKSENKYFEEQQRDTRGKIKDRIQLERRNERKEKEGGLGSDWTDLGSGSGLIRSGRFSY